MSQELEAAAVDSVPAVLRRTPKDVLPIGAPCPNCATPLAGPWCHACGQSAEDFHHSLWKLAAEAFGGLVDVDSRLWRTLPHLFFKPGRLTRDYLDGHRASQAPPFRMFLIVVVLVFLAAGPPPAGAPSRTVGLAPGEKLHLGDNIAVNTVTPESKLANIEAAQNDPTAKWVLARMQTAAKNPTGFEASMITWAQRLAVLTLPLSALLLGLMFFWRRGVFMFDHLIFSMHSLSFQGILLSAVMMLERASDWAALLVIASPVHLFVHLRRTYGVGVFGALIRMVVLFAGAMIGFMLLMVGLVFIGLYEVGR